MFRFEVIFVNRTRRIVFASNIKQAWELAEKLGVVQWIK